MKAFDPYHVWLGIQPKDQPPHHYRLLGLELFEADLKVIESAADRQRAYVKQHQAGPHSVVSQRLLNELSKATICLLDATAKAKYDEELRIALKPPVPTAPVPAASVPAASVPAAPRPITSAPAAPVPSPQPVPLRPVPVKAIDREPMAAAEAPAVRVSNRYGGTNRARSAFPAPVIVMIVAAAALLLAAGVLHQLWNGNFNQPPPQAIARQKKSTSTVSKPKTVSPVPVKPTLPRIPHKNAEPTHPLPPTSPPPIPAPDNHSTLQQAQIDYERDRAEFVKLISAHLTESEATARSGTDEKLLTAATAARDAFETHGQFPADAPAAAIEKMVASRVVVEKALTAVLQSAVASQNQPAIESANQELTRFMATESADVGDVVHRYPRFWFRLINVNSNLALGVSGEGKQRGSAVVQRKDDPGNQLLHWRVKHPGTHYSRLQNRQSKQVLNVPASDRNQGVHLIQWSDEGGSNGFFELRYRGSHYNIRSLFSGHLVSVANARRDENLQVIQWRGHGGDDQKWKLVRMLGEDKD